jgi:hypothetical protein
MAVPTTAAHFLMPSSASGNSDRHSPNVDPIQRLASSPERGAPQLNPVKPSCPGSWEVVVELGEVHERCVLCGEIRQIGN